MPYAPTYLSVANIYGDDVPLYLEKQLERLLTELRELRENKDL
jgi:hypothetical protein